MGLEMMPQPLFPHLISGVLLKSKRDNAHEVLIKGFHDLVANEYQSLIVSISPIGQEARERTEALPIEWFDEGEAPARLT